MLISTAEAIIKQNNPLLAEACDLRMLTLLVPTYASCKFTRCALIGCVSNKTVSSKQVANKQTLAKQKHN